MIEYNIRPDREAEEAALAYCLVNPESAPKFLALVKPTDMFTDEGVKAYSRIAALVAEGAPVNVHSLALDGISAVWLGDIVRANVNTGSVSLEYWAEFIQRQGRARRIVSAAAKAISAVTDGRHPDDVAFDLGNALKDDGRERRMRTRSVKEILEDDGYPAMLEWLADPKRLAGPATGIDRLDTYLGGLGLGRLIAIGADTGIGKSAFIQHLARQCSQGLVPTHVISTEMADREVFFRLAFMEAGWDKLRVSIRGHVRTQEREDMLDGLDRLASRPLFLTELKGMDVDAVEAEIDRVREREGTQVVILDLLNGLPTIGDNRAQGIANNTAKLKQIAESMRVALLMTAHVNRDSAKGVSEMGLHSFKDSGAIEQDADQALILVPVDEGGARMPREEVTRIVNNGNPINVAVRICKNRHGAEGTVTTRLHWGHGGRFYPVDAA